MMNSPGRHNQSRSVTGPASIAARVFVRAAIAAVSVAYPAARAAADDLASGGPAPAAPAVPAVVPAAPRSQSHALLEQMSRESQALYQDVQAGIVRLQLPAPRWLNELAARDNPVDKWGAQLTAQVRGKLEDERRGVQQGDYKYVGVRVAPATQPGAAGDGAAAANENAQPWRLTQIAGSDTMVLESIGAGAPAAIQIQTGGALDNGHVVVGGPPRLTLQPASAFAPNNVGLMFDGAGHVLVSLYLEKEAVGDAGVRASVGDGPVITAKFVASDRQTNLSVFQLPPASGKPVRLGTGRPADGSLVMLLAPSNSAARLAVWTGGQRDAAGVVVNADGTVAGFARYGQFVACGACRGVVDQLVKYGRVRRAVLGISVREVQRDDAARQLWPELAGRPALRVSDVQPGSAAERAGLQAADLILSVGDDPVGDPPGFAAAIADRSGRTILHLLRGGEPVDVTVDLKPQ
jgi:S1-C subfamily serine protease